MRNPAFTETRLENAAGEFVRHLPATLLQVEVETDLRQELLHFQAQRRGDLIFNLDLGEWVFFCLK